MESLAAGSLTIQATLIDESIRLEWLGKSNDRQPGRDLNPYFGRIAAEAADRHMPLEMHFEKLEYFNSSTITAIIQLIQDLRQKRVPLRVVYSGSVKWQRLGFDALRIFDKGDQMLTFKAI